MSKKHAAYTEAEAFDKWCPFVRTAAQHPYEPQTWFSGLNRDWQGMPPSSMCVGSKCMAWRWHTTYIEDPDDGVVGFIESTNTYGFCGLAGQP